MCRRSVREQSSVSACGGGGGAQPPPAAAGGALAWLVEVCARSEPSVESALGGCNDSTALAAYYPVSYYMLAICTSRCVFMRRTVSLNLRGAPRGRRRANFSHSIHRYASEHMATTEEWPACRCAIPAQIGALPPPPPDRERMDAYACSPRVKTVPPNACSFLLASRLHFTYP